jgi:predicted enzyme related to lactoylglutathione lyase
MSKIVLWVSDLHTQKAFYELLLDAHDSDFSNDFSHVNSGSNSVLLHQLPPPYASASPLTQQLHIQDEVAIKPIFTVSSIESAVDRISGTFATIKGEKFTHNQSIYLDVIDPEGNIIQLEEIQK